MRATIKPTGKKELRIGITVPISDDLFEQHKALGPVLAVVEELKAKLPEDATVDHAIVSPRPVHATKA